MPTWYEYRWHKGISRYYAVYLSKDLFNHWLITCVWGGLRSKLGNYKTYSFIQLEEALKTINHMKNRRSKRGYNLVLQRGPDEIPRCK